LLQARVEVFVHSGKQRQEGDCETEKAHCIGSAVRKEVDDTKVEQSGVEKGY
jgi:hypothetical protein